MCARVSTAAMRRSAEQAAVQWLALRLPPPLDLQELDLAPPQTRRRWWLSSNELLPPVVVAAAALLWRETWGGTTGGGAYTVLALAAVGAALGVELLYQVLLLRRWWKARQVLAAVSAYADAKEAFEVSYQTSVELVKKAELAVRGYRIGALLPPVGRIERSTRLKCGLLRRQLRALNELMVQAAAQLRNHESLSALTEWSGPLAQRESDETQAAAAPSLLLSALLKRHDLANVLLERSLHALLLECVSAHGSSPADNALGLRAWRPWSTLNSLLGHFQALSAALVRWQAELDRSTSSRGVQALARSRDSATDERERPAAPRANGDSVDEQLAELRSACETLRHLVFAAQQDVAAAPRQPAATAALAETRGLMRTTLQRLNDAWREYEKAVDVGGSDATSDVGDNGVAGADDCAAEARATQQQQQQQEQQHEKERAAQEAAQLQERGFTLVFTGTSTGERDFDLKALLTRPSQSAPPTPQFVRELQSHSLHKVKTKQIDHDDEPSRAARAVVPATAAARVVHAPRSGVLHSELQSLLRLQRVAGAEDFFGGDE
ncbi:hypothetical protein PybrP1_011645 [[Pythium] brassicae (nom. inval.)]|nr:hypothetical protein PybrP1_011645 [[Pythium] brassicae (nom. inval.)]